MKHLLAWAVGVTFAILVAGYLCLTIGTSLFLPEAWKNVEPGMTRHQVRSQIPLEWVDTWRWYTSFQEEDYPKKPPSNWMATPEPSTVPGNFDLLSGKMGFRLWNMRIEYTNETVSNIEHSYTDLHDRLLMIIRM